MLSTRSIAIFALSITLAAPAAFASRGHHSRSSAHASAHSPTHNPTHSPAHSRFGHKAAAKSHKLHGQQAIDSDRVTEIQQALIREHYLNGEANGQWDTETAAAMQKYQADQGWQTKLMPDSRALKKLGLGPDYSNAINARTATFSDPPPLTTMPSDQVSGFAQAARVSR